ncbi:MAG: septation protein SpoVG family protein [Planctomycetes bacterium]|nr:septation protein SpoVG family protein [Planctomycetota bacterium]MCC7173032.1 SpoVG family protein [Planctomycetota bacterium]
MKVSEIRVKLVSDRTEKLQAFCTITLDDDFVVRDIKIIEGPRGPFVAMPSRKLSDRCPRCHSKNHLRAKFCNECAFKLPVHRSGLDQRGRARLHTDIAHPVNPACRQYIEQAILAAFHAELERSKTPGYVAPNLDDFDDYVGDDESQPFGNSAAT